jgi:hypothetical protein
MNREEQIAIVTSSQADAALSEDLANLVADTTDDLDPIEVSPPERGSHEDVGGRLETAAHQASAD